MAILTIDTESENPFLYVAFARTTGNLAMLEANMYGSIEDYANMLIAVLDNQPEFLAAMTEAITIHAQKQL